MTPQGSTRLITVSNRLPVVLDRDASQDSWRVRPGEGGLVTALAPVLRDRGGIWIGWPGTVREDKAPVDELLAEASRDIGYDLRAVELSDRERLLYYRGFANEIIWPLFHDLQSLCRFVPDYWHAYQRVNRKFAATVHQYAQRDDFIWVHDYHLMMLASELRNLGLANRLGFFLHIPFPPPDLFMNLPWRLEVLRHLLAFDLVGFQTPRDRRNFVHCLRAIDQRDLQISGRGSRTHVRYQDREILLGNFPIGIDYDGFLSQAQSEAVADAAWYLHEEFPERVIVLGVDRLDYTKGIPERLRAFRSALRRYPDLRGKVVMVQIVVPSRWQIPHYRDLKEQIERLVGQINGEFTRPGWAPVHYQFRSLDRTQLLAYYRTAEVLLTTPWKDGMNLVAKEYCACNVDGNGVLILSEFAGATAQLHRDSLLVNPHDIEGVADALHTAIGMDVKERRQRMVRLRRIVRKYDVFWWVNSFLESAIARRLDSFPVLEDYVPDGDGDCGSPGP